MRDSGMSDSNLDPCMFNVWCLVADLNNPPLPDGRGSVAYPFEIAKYPVTNTQYCEFLNAVPEGGDRYFT